MNVGITSSIPFNPDGTTHEDAAAYARAVERAGGAPVFLPNDADRVDDLLASVAGIVVSGGVDVDVALYGGRVPHARSQAHRYRPERDRFEIALLRAARERRVPVLCICRGLQVANVAFGGTLIEDVREELEERTAIEHRYADERGVERAEYAPGHVVAVAAESALAELAGSTEFATNSMHHQAVKMLAPGLVAVGRTSDGIVEAVSAAFEHPFFHGVQWHPEEIEDAVGRRLFAGLVAASAAR